MRTTLFFMIAVISAKFVTAQESYIDAPANRAKNGELTIYGMANYSSIPYESINGSPFWRDEWKLATMYTDNPKEKWTKKVKINLATGEIYFQEPNGNELVVANNIVKSIVFYKNDDLKNSETKFDYLYDAVLLNKNTSNAFVQELTTGNIKLLKLITKTVASKDSLFGTLKTFYFVTNTKYFIYTNNKAYLLKKLNKENILEHLPEASSYENWTKNNKIDYKKEEDAVKLLNEINKH